MFENLSMPSEISLLGIIFLVALFLGRLASKVQVPKVTAYILVGIVFGPTLLNFLNSAVAHQYETFNEVAFGLILFNIGGEFHKGLFKKLEIKHIIHSIILAFLILIITASISFLFALTTSMTLGHQIAYSLILGTIAIAAAPPTTLIVVKELDAEGPLTHLTMVFLSIGTIITLVLSQVFTIGFTQLQLWPAEHVTLSTQLIYLTLKLFGSFITGVFLGFLLSLIVEREKKEGEVLFAVIGIILFGQSIANFFHMDPLLTALFTGFSLVNFAPTGMNVHKILKDAGSSIFALFFILAGSHIHLQEQFQTVGILGLGYIIARTVAILLGSHIAAYFSKEPKVIGKYLGTALLSHAGAALAIALTLSKYQASSAQTAMTVVIGSIFFFELVGPLMLKYSLKAMNEVNASSSGTGSTKKVIHSPKELFVTFLINIGIIHDSEIHHDQAVGNYICRNLLTIRQDANFNQVIKFINDHQMPSYPVSNSEGDLVGTISFNAIKRAKGKFNAPSSVTAQTLAIYQDYLTEDQNVVEAMEIFDNLGIAALPVVRKGSKKLIGILHYKDIIIAQ